VNVASQGSPTAVIPEPLDFVPQPPSDQQERRKSVSFMGLSQVGQKDSLARDDG
jgi:hypothetical protein